jgi:hypothetical protein
MKEQLLAWPVQVKAAQLEQCLEDDFFDTRMQATPAELLGLVVLWFAAVFGREHASEGEIWPPVARQFPEPQRRVLFVQGHPRQPLKWAMEAACQRFGLRNAFGRHGGQAYYLTVYLQFGFTLQGMARLPLWLSGHALPLAIRILLAESSVFRQLWEKLRRNESASDHPFWPVGWTGQKEVGSTPGVRLVWGEPGVHFEIEVAVLFPGLEDGSYQLAEPFEWFQVTDGKPYPEKFTVLTEMAQLNLSLTSLLDDRTYHQELCLWEEGELQFWDELGRSRQTPQVGTTVRLPEGWKLLSQAARRQDNWAQIASLPLQLCDESGQEQVWNASSPHPLAGVSLEWEAARVTYLPFELEGVVRGLNGEARCKGAELRQELGTWVVRKELPADLPAAEAKVRLSQQGRTRTLKGPVQLHVITWRHQQQWQTFQDLGRTDLGWLGSCPFRFLGDFGEYGLLEGTRFLGRPNSQAAVLPNLCGYGAPILLRRGPFNPLDQPDRKLVTCLVQQRLLKGVHFEGDGYRLEFLAPLTVTEEHRLLFWDGQQLLQTALQTKGPLPLEKPILVAIAYRGSCLGSVWTRFRYPSHLHDVQQAAHLMRWAHMPLLEFTFKMQALQWMKGRELEFLEAWLEEGWGDFQQRANEGWYEVLRALIPIDLELSPRQAKDLLGKAPWRHWLRIHPKLLEHLLSTSQSEAEIGWLSRNLAKDLEEKAERQMGVDRRWLEKLMERYFEGKSNLDLEVALAFPAFQELLLREYLR